jgi:hypothetical protein
MTDKMKEIKTLENKYGLVLFRMGLTHLVDAGIRNLKDDNIEESIQLIISKGDEDKANGIVSIMTPEFQCEILRCAAELANFNIWELFMYIKKYVTISDY